MWIISFLPEWAIHFIFGLGILGTLLGFVLGFLSFVRPYKFAIQIISILLLSLGVYLEGGLADYKEWELKVKEAELKVAKAEAESARLNTELQAALSNKNSEVRQKGETIIKYIDRYKDREVIKTLPGEERVRVEEVIKYVENCPVPKELLDIHNNAARMNKSAEDKK